MAVGEWDQRQLCPDGGCIGVIGPDGTCKVCGRAAPNWGDERNRGLIHPPDEGAEDDGEEDEDELAAEGDDDEDYADEDDADGDEDDADGDEDDDADEANGAEAGGGEDAPRGEWSARRLCPDGACIGVIGPDGRCKVCGRRDTEAPTQAATQALDEAPDAPARDPAEAPAPAAAASAAEPAARDREPCTTPGCGGQIGADGRCAVCGKGVS